MRPALTLAVSALLVASTLGFVPVAAADAPTDLSTDRATDRTTASAATGADGPATAAHAARSTQPNGTDACAPVAAGDGAADPSADVLGWENGCWYNESLAVTPGDGLNETELDAVVSRSIARVEQIREFEFNETVPVSVISREAYRNRTDFTTNSTANDRLHQNVKWEATFMVNESADALGVLESTLGSSVLGFYEPTRDQITIVSENTSTPQIDELTLAHELVHAVQDQRYNITRYNQSTTGLSNAIGGIVEGDARYVDTLYNRRCGEEWECAAPSATGDGGGGGGGAGDLHYGVYFTQYVPYTEGSEFVQARRESGGWAAVNEVYENPPASTEQVIHPEKYPAERPANLTVERSASDPWRMLDLEGGVDHATFGEGGLFSMMYYPSYVETQATMSATTVVIPYAALFDFREGTTQLEEIGPYNYSHPITEGWAGDRLVPYVTDESAETNETGYVWKLAWDSAADAQEFRDAYVSLLEYHGAQPVDGRENTYRIPDGQEFSDAFYLSLEDDTLVLVNGPTVEDLSQIREGAAPEGETTETETETETTTESETETTETETTTEPPTSDPGVPATTATDDSPETSSPTDAAGTTAIGAGFGLVAALVALLGLGLVIAGRRRADR